MDYSNENFDRMDRLARKGSWKMRVVNWVLLILLASALAGVIAKAQPTSISFQSGVPNPATNVGAVYAGAGGSSPIFYWVVARFPGGSTQPSAVGVALSTQGSQNLSSTNTVTVTWTGVTGATGYDVVRSDTSGFPAPCTCAVVLNTASLSVTDNGSALSVYPPAGVPTIQPALATLSVDNVNQTTPYINVQLVNSSLRMALSPRSWTAGNCVQIGTDGNLADFGAVCGSTPGTVTTGVTLTTGLPVIGAGGSAIAIGTRQGSTTKYISMGAGTPGTNECAKFDASGNIVGSGAVCSTGDIVGPASAINSAIALYDGITGKLLKDSATLLPVGALVGAGQSNAWSTGTQDMSAATAFIAKVAAAFAPTANGSLGLNSTNFRLVFGANSLTHTVAELGAGTPNTNDCAKFDASGNLVTAGAACGTGTVATGSPYVTLNGSLFGPVYAISDPGLQTWSWVNQGGATITDTNGQQTLIGPATAGVALRVRTHTAPATPYTLTSIVKLYGNGTAFIRLGVGFREAGTGKIKTIGALTNASLNVDNWTNETTFSSAPVSLTWTLGAAMVWFRLTNNGTNISLQISTDGTAFYTLQTEAVNAFFTTAPDQLCFFVDPNQATFPASISIISWNLV